MGRMNAAFGDVLRWLPGSLALALRSPGKARLVERISWASSGLSADGTRKPAQSVVQGGHTLMTSRTTT